MTYEPMVATGTSDETAGLDQGITLCQVRGFHGPFGEGEGEESTRSDGHAICAICGQAVQVADHLAAYQIARFHGLAP